MRFLRNESGFTIIDAVIAVAIVVVGMASVIGVYNKVAFDVTTNKNYNVKAYIAQDIMERLKLIDGFKNKETVKKEISDSLLFQEEYLDGLNIDEFSQKGSLDDEATYKFVETVQIKDFEEKISEEDNENRAKKKYEVTLVLKLVNSEKAKSDEEDDKDKESLLCVIKVKEKDVKKDISLVVPSYYRFKYEPIDGDNRNEE